MKQRLASIDVVRLLALAAIVWGHTFGPSELADRVILSWHLPIFFVLTGYFWSGRRPFRDVVRTRARTLMVPYVAWFVLITLLSLPRRWDGGLPAVAHAVALAALGGNYAKQPYTTFWFFTALFAAVVGYRLLQRAPTAVRLLVVAGGLLANVVAGGQLARIPFALGTALGALAFLELGRAVRALEQRLTPRGRGLTALALGGVVVAVLALIPGDFVAMDMKSGRFPLPAVLITLALEAAIVLAATAWTSMPARWAHLVTTLAKPSLVVIFLHPLFLYYLGRDATDLPQGPVFVVSLLVPLAIGVLLMRTRWAPLLLGIATERPDRRDPARDGSPQPAEVTAP